MKLMGSMFRRINMQETDAGRTISIPVIRDDRLNGALTSLVFGLGFQTRPQFASSPPAEVVVGNDVIFTQEYSLPPEASLG